MLLKKSSKRARSGFKRKKLTVAGSYQEIKAKGGAMMAANPSHLLWVRAALARSHNECLPF
jgi:hypothetical protein